MGDWPEIQATEGEVEIPYDRDASSTPVCQLTTPTPKISPIPAKVSDVGRGSTGNLAAGREPVPTDRPSY
jgi:hypothetical protein